MSEFNSYVELESNENVLSRQRLAEGSESTVTIREKILQYKLSLLQSEYTFQKNFNVLLCTWNVNGKGPSQPLRTWLSYTEDSPDIYAIGFQELDLSKEAFIFNDTPREEEWQNAVTKSLHAKSQYRLVASVRLVGILLIVYVKDNLFSSLKNISCDTVGTGLMGRMGNKGGAIVRFQLYNTTLCFVNAHLAANTEELERRNQDFYDICSRTYFKKAPNTIKDHDQIFWFGDLNYRLSELSLQSCKAMLESNQLSKVLEYDQLNTQRQYRKIFVDYEEAPIDFKPTYKYDPGTDTFDTSEKARTPSWCDRILWKVPPDTVTVLTYRSHADMKISDHKPVSAFLTTKLRIVDPEKYRKVHEKILKELDKIENEFLPQVTVDKTEINFDIVKVFEKQTETLIIANTGQVPVSFQFVNKFHQKNSCPDWLRVLPLCGSIKPGEKCDVYFEVQLETALKELYVILVLHLEQGKDVFITISAKCQRSCFTMSLAQLCRSNVPVGHLTEQQFSHICDSESSILYAVPREIWMMIDHINRHGMTQKNLFEGVLVPSKLIEIRDWLDFGKPEPLPKDVQHVSEALLLILLYMSEPLIPYRLHDLFAESAHSFSASKQLIENHLSQVELQLFMYLCFFLQELLQHTKENGLDAKTLASIFANVILRNPSKENNKKCNNRMKSTFVHNFLVNDIAQYANLFRNQHRF